MRKWGETSSELRGINQVMLTIAPMLMRSPFVFKLVHAMENISMLKKN